MKLTHLILCVLFLSQYAECKPFSLSISNVYNTITNKAKNITSTILERARSIKNHFHEKAKEEISNKVEWMRGRFHKYITEAEKTGNKIFDSIAWEHKEYTCSDEDPAVFMTTPQLIAAHGYHAEAHTVITHDGYILTLHRIPFAKNMTKSSNKTALLHHGVLGSSADWVISGPGKGLAYILSEAGYDVWMANVRGNIYSRAHVSRNTNTYAFWNFTFHEVSQYDLPTIIDFITDTKGKDVKINYIGYSMGTTSLFALLSTKTEYNKILRAGFALAPVAFMSNLESPIELLAKFSHSAETIMKLIGVNEFLPRNGVQRWLAKHSCKINSLEEALCENSMFILCGFNEKQLNRTLFPLILGHVPSGASTKTLIHYMQEIRSDGKFRRFNYGIEGNLREYGQGIPPEYPLSKITLPIALFSAEGDWLAPVDDVRNLEGNLTKPLTHYVVPLKDFNHLDFLWANDAPNLVYKKLLELMESDFTS